MAKAEFGKKYTVMLNAIYYTSMLSPPAETWYIQEYNAIKDVKYRG